MHAPLKIVMAAVLMAAGCASTQPATGSIGQAPAASAEECGLIRTALLSVVNEEPYYSKPAPPPAVSYIAFSPYLVSDAFDDNPYAATRDVTPVNIKACIGASLNGPRGRIMGFANPRQAPEEGVLDRNGWVSRPVVSGDKATVLLRRGQCYLTSTIELTRDPANAWRVSRIRHSDREIVWSGAHPCDAWR